MEAARIGYAAAMAKKPEQLGQAALVGWRKAIADRVARPAAKRAPVSEERARAIVGAAFFALSAYYVTSTIRRMLRTARA
ncbi:MAG: hypothetical protein QOD55_1130 [Solirubrobacteraceae bacterium]|nr:hypothetical protein [Solirubrobacteraceae bacterium]MEA2289133.1 hypothetical protein [Solirubrobacteraceae bacterium]